MFEPTTDSFPRLSVCELPRKLRLAMRVVGCATQKEMHARLKTLNPNTGYEPSRAYKWAQGRSTPRDPSVYDDLVRLLELPVAGEVLRSCSYEEFRRLLEARHGAAVPAEAAAAPATVAEPLSDGIPVPGYLAGSYLALSRAWSRHRGPGWLLAGGMTVRPDPAGGLAMDYVEELPGGALEMAGAVRRIGRSLHVLLTSLDQEMLIATTYTLPTAPAPILSGVMSGVALHDAEMRPAACRLIGLRLPEGSPASRTASGYLEATAAAIADRLGTAGMASALATRLAPGVLAFVTDPGDQGLVDAPASGVNSLVGLMLGEEDRVAAK